MINRLLFLAVFAVVMTRAAEKTIPFDSLLNIMLENDQKVRALELNLEAKKKASEAAQAWLPTELSLETVNLGTEEISLNVGQEFELASQKKNRSQTLKNEMARLKTEIVLRKAESETKLGEKYVEALSLQERLQFLDSLQNLMGSTNEWLIKSVKAGLGSDLDVMRMQLDLKEVEFKKRQYQRDFANSIAQINALCGISLPESIYLSTPLTSFFSKEESIGQSSSAYEEIAQKQVLIEESKIAELDVPFISSLKLEGGATRSQVEKTTHANLNLAIALPLFSRNSSRVAEQRLLAEAAKSEAKNLSREVEVIKRELFNKIESIKQELKFLEQELLPSTLAVLNEMNRLTQAGVFSFIDYQASRRDYLALKEQQFKLFEELGKSYLNLKIYHGETQNVIQ